MRVAQAEVGEYLAEARASWKFISENYRIENPVLEPTVSLAVNGGSLEFSLSYVTDYTKRTVMKTKLFTKIVEEVANSNGRLAWASQTITLTSPPAAADTRGAGQAAASQ